MDIQTEKIELAKRLLDTEDKNIIDAVKSVFKTFDSDNAWGDLPEKVVLDVQESIRQIDAGLEISHDKARETFKKWL
ncbi:hypothetical protein MUK70_25940 [Dyadobacter chenwenxiniae]|uniref:Addiction module component n=1 Tax=Dyadobacter chenwenxiniae TaxID=2906456 RepID=A0A9X1PNU7_9BACT|nr:hypothetical protein [Dyadobacter chenwenxiniae]MCF0051039.1 hypothetical protein [Dyadobacter chenwenxiniae]MCF0064328.1 hypothetical protein [Dyadobacter chenwenxiniae]UON82461.1 hypothetical protein MUK70_25940 [Dyadobacter chenwenxiniae]